MKTSMTALAFFLAIAAVTADGQTTLADGVNELSKRVDTAAAKAERKNVAVLPFTEFDGRTTVLGSFLAEEVITQLVNDGFSVVDRVTLEQAMSKHVADGAITPSAARAVGTLIGADALISGTIVDMASQVGINCRVIDTKSGEIFAAADARVTKDDDVKKIMATELSRKKTEPTRNPTSRQKTFERSGIRYTVESATRSEQNVSMLVVLEHDKDENVLANPGEWYLIDNNGDRWSHEWDSKGILVNGGITILPGTKIRSTFHFDDGSCNGTFSRLRTKTAPYSFAT